MSSYTMPTFIIGGVVAGGTSFLSQVLIQHPEIYLPKVVRPEPSFFYKSWEYQKGLDYYCSRWFAEVPKSAVAVGERSSNYLFGGQEVAARIAEHLPKVKLIFTLRNPIERAWGNYRFTVLEGLENLSFEDALKIESQRISGESGIWAEIQPRNYTGRGYYAKQLKAFLSYFPRRQLLIIKSEALASDTDKELRKVYEFLGVEDLDFTARTPPNHTSQSIVDPDVQMALRNYFGDRFDTIIEATRKELDLTQFAHNKKDADAIVRLQNNMKGKKEKISPAARAYLAEIYTDDIRELQDIVDFDTSDWR